MTQRRENIVIAHRGNQEGPCPQWENHPEYIQTALNAGFHVEVDVRLSRYSADHCMLGHGPTDQKLLFLSTIKNTGNQMRGIRLPMVATLIFQNLSSSNTKPFANRFHIWRS
jgi:hypothetical protein